VNGQLVVYKIATAIYSVMKRAKLVPTDTADISDNYIRWLCYANAGMLYRGNLYCFDYATKNLVSVNPILEIGSFLGLSTNAIAYYLRKNGKSSKVITCDRWVFKGTEIGDYLDNYNISHETYREFIRDTFIRNVKMFSSFNLPYTIEEFSDDFFRMWAEKVEVKDVLGRSIKLGGSISFCYIDGNHQYEYVKRDFENVHKYLEPGGFLLFDDSADGVQVGSAKLMNEVIKHSDYELVVKNPNYLFRRIR
jgi:predicted O-methyltransferase YrrM